MAFPYMFSMCLALLSFLILLSIASFLLIKWFHRQYRRELKDALRLKNTEMGNRKVKLTQLQKERFTVSFENLSLSVGSTQVLTGVSGKFIPGRVTAIMGSSGCGKSSLLNVLSGRANYGKTSGLVKINGKDASINKYKRIVGFVPQEDIMIRILTVEEILSHSAQTRLPANRTNLEMEQVVEEVMDLLGLSHIRHSYIGDETVKGISGGQRKRVNIAMELVANPTMLFLDEPTSGLDSTSSQEICQALKRLAYNAGLTVVAVIHQPRYEIFELFDDVALLGKGGRPVYFGPTSLVGDYFAEIGFVCPARINPADYYLDVISGVYDGKVTPKWPIQVLNDISSCASLTSMSEEPLSNQSSEENYGLKYVVGSAFDTKNDLSTCEKLQQLWALSGSQWVRKKNKEHNVSDNDNFGDITDDFYSEDDAKIVENPKNKIEDDDDSKSFTQPELANTKKGDNEKEGEDYPKSTSTQRIGKSVKNTKNSSRAKIGTFLELFVMFFGCLIMPFLLIVFVVPQFPMRSLRSQFGSVFGALISGIVWAIILWILLVPLQLTHWSMAYFLGPFLGVCCLCLIYSVYLYYNSIHLRQRKRPQLITLFVVGMISGPLILLIYPRLSRKENGGLWAGFSCTVFMTVYIVALQGYLDNPAYSLIGVAVVLLLLAKMVTFIYRYIHLPVFERDTKGFFVQTWLFARREFILQTRRWRELLFHLSQLCFGGIFLGFIFYNRPYQGPLFQYIEKLQGGSSVCPDVLSPLLVLKPLCSMLQFPTDDPLVPMASLNLLTVALSATSFSINIFGRERTIFQRESSAGIATGAYFLGKNLAYIPLSIVAPTLYLVCFGGLATLKADWIYHFCLLLLCYVTFTGVGYVISLVVEPGVAQLFGVFFVLVGMMFSGANPTIPQLQQNELLGNVLYFPTFISFNRWGIQLFYMVELEAYKSTYSTMELIYGYHISQLATCWSVVVFMSFCYRILLYILLVTKEP